MTSVVVMMLLHVVPSLFAKITLPAMIADNMVLQRGQEVPIWGWGAVGEEVRVVFAGQTLATTCDENGAWRVNLAPMKANATPSVMTVAGENTLQIDNVLVGEVWLCSGQSNMAMPVRHCWNADLEHLAARHPEIRMITNPNLGTQLPQTNFNEAWEICTPEKVPWFSAVGYFFGRALHEVLNVPIGLIDISHGSSTCEAWIRRDLLEGREIYAPLMKRWQTTERTFDFAAAQAVYKSRVAAWNLQCDQAKVNGRPLPKEPRPPRDQLKGPQRPSNLYNARLLPVIPYGIRGVIWYQGEANVTRAYQYREMFPLMITHWRDIWGQGDFPFYWVQLADFNAEQPEPGDSMWAELREAQTLTLNRLPNTGEAVSIDLGEASDIHPKNKQEVGLRLARLALARDYQVKIPFQSAQYESMTIKGRIATITFAHVNGTLRTVDHKKINGFAIASEDKKWVWANARLTSRDQVEVWSDKVETPVAVRYAWADNPVCNLYDEVGLPVTPFRTDEWPGLTADSF